MTKIYHLALVIDWQLALEAQKTYFPPTYQQDGFTHGTADTNRLIEVANHFYTASQGDWLCLEMTEDSLAKQDIEVRFEPAANVGDTNGTLKEKTKPGERESEEVEPMLFPHIYGGIHPDVVIASYPVTRDQDGSFVEILLSQPNDA